MSKRYQLQLFEYPAFGGTVLMLQSGIKVTDFKFSLLIML